MTELGELGWLNFQNTSECINNAKYANGMTWSQYYNFKTFALNVDFMMTIAVKFERGGIRLVKTPVPWRTKHSLCEY